MKIKNISGMLLGTCIVYVAMAACSGSDRPITIGAGGSSSASGMGGAIGMGGTSGMGGAGMAGASGTGGVHDDGGSIFDALTDPVPDAAADPTSGSRLKAKYWKAVDGARAPIPYTWYDSQRSEDCSFRTAIDGTQRCLPNSYVFAIYYADAACTAPLAYVNSGCSVPPYVQVGGTSSCAGPDNARIYPTLAKVQLATVYIQGGANCTSSPTPSSLDYYIVGSEIPSSAFVQGFIEIDL